VDNVPRSSEIRLSSSVARCHRKKPTEHLHLPVFRARTNREHCPMLGSRPAVEKHDGARQGGDLVPTLGLRSRGQAHISRRASWPVASIRWSWGAIAAEAPRAGARERAARSRI